ncbi:interleukin-13 receptor subunit alpha-1-like [Pyxicephalus adspersus]|uniref:interleukin-13 receptor subunit alpha-1-like n=1 Tax=Pyxicephalus adspersus TaxID=30357 RepID=UPI003B594A9D
MDRVLCHIGLILTILYFVGSTASANDTSTNNITFGLQGMYRLYWEWKAPNASCSLRYTKEFRTSKNEYSKKENGSQSNWVMDILRNDNIDLNGKISLFVKANCGITTIDSLSRTVQIAPGDEGTAVKNFQCIWHYQEHVRCTWQPGPNTPPNVNYRILYWVKDTNYKRGPKIYSLEKFWDLVETGKTCELDSSNDLKSIGCQFVWQKPIQVSAHFAIVVTDTSRIIKPYIYYEDSFNIVKFRPPKITEAYRTINNSIYVSWNKSHYEVEYQLLLTSSREQREPYLMSHSTTIFNVFPDVTYTVKVRVKLSSFYSTGTKSLMWSDWSQEIILEGKEQEKVLSLFLPLVISVLVIITAIILLVNMEKIKALVCPQIPDPARIFPKDLEQWLKNDMHMVYTKPEKEDICPVHLIENPPSTKCV